MAAMNPSSSNRPSGRTVILAFAVAIAAAVALVAVALIGRSDSSAPPTATPVVDLTGIPQDGRVLGSPDAEVTLVEWADPQCPACRTYTEEFLPTVVDEYVRPGTVNTEFRGFPFIGDDSVKAYRFLLAAGEQNKLWDLQEALYRNQGGENDGWVTDDLIRELASEIDGLDVDQLFADAERDDIVAEADGAEAAGQAAGIQGTPTLQIVIGDAGAVRHPGRQRRSAAGSSGRRARRVTDRSLRLAAAIVALAGVVVAGYLTWVHFDDAALVCVAGGGCETVQESEYAEIAGIPVAALGLVAYAIVLGLVAWDAPLARLGAATIALVGLLFSMYLLALQLFVIDAVCVWCMANDVVIAPALAVLTALRLRS